MAKKSVPPPTNPPEPPDEYVQPASSRVARPAILLSALALLVLIIWFSVRSAWTPPEDPATQAARTGPPAVRLRPSLIVPGPMQVPHSADPGEAARPDEAVLFRADVTGSGYVFVGVEDAEGNLTRRVYGGRPDEEPVTGTTLIYEDRKALAYALEPHKGETVHFVIAISAKPWDPLPSRIPSTPRTYPDPGGAAAPPPPPPFVAWDRFDIQVAPNVVVPQELK